MTDHVDHVDRLLVFHASFMLGQTMTVPNLDLPVIYTHVIYTLKHTPGTRSLGLTKYYGIHFTSVYVDKIFQSVLYVYIYSNTQKTPHLSAISARFSRNNFLFQLT